MEAADFIALAAYQLGPERPILLPPANLSMPAPVDPHNVYAGAGVGMELNPGDKVRHPKWGEGTVVNTVGAGGDGLLTINFPNGGQKMENY